jgi:glycosyltransferase involved in cell wall biosynthesis
MSTPARMLITIGITCFNAAATIGRAIKSALAQDWSDFEVVVVDDASSDSSVAILKEWVAKDGRIRLYRHQENRGCAAARNTIIHQAAGAFIAFFDDDDTSSSDRLRVQHERIISYEKVSGAALVACYASGTRYYPNGYKMPILAIGSRPTVPVGTVLADYLLAFVKQSKVFYGGGTPTCSLMARIETFVDVGGFDESMRRQEDADFAVRLALKGGHFIGTPELLLQQFATTGSEKKARIEHESLRRLLDKNRGYLQEKGLYDYMLGWSEIRFSHFNRQPLRTLLALLRLSVRYPLRAVRHFLVSASRRYWHERNMRAHG